MSILDRSSMHADMPHAAEARATATDLRARLEAGEVVPCEAFDGLGDDVLADRFADMIEEPGEGYRLPT